MENEFIRDVVGRRNGKSPVSAKELQELLDKFRQDQDMLVKRRAAEKAAEKLKAKQNVSLINALFLVYLVIDGIYIAISYQQHSNIANKWQISSKF